MKAAEIWVRILDPRSWIANRRHHSKMTILHICDRSVALREGPWRKSFEKSAKCCDFHDFWWFFTKFDRAGSGVGQKIWTYILFGSISMSDVQIFQNIRWSQGRRSQKLKITILDRTASLAWTLAKSVPAEQKCEFHAKVRADGSRFWSFAFLNGAFYSRANHDGTEVDFVKDFKNLNLWNREFDVQSKGRWCLASVYTDEPRLILLRIWKIQTFEIVNLMYKARADGAWLTRSCVPQ